MLLSIIIPVHNEEHGLENLMARLAAVLDRIDADHEVIFVNDGSTDRTGAVLDALTAMNCRIRVVTFPRTVGRQAAVTAGLEIAGGDAAVVMDADLQDPPELLPEMLDLMRQGYDVVSAQRQTRPGDRLFKRPTIALFYPFVRRFVDKPLRLEAGGDFRLFSRDAVLAVRECREQHRLMHSLVASLGLKEVIIPFQREERAHGTTNA